MFGSGRTKRLASARKVHLMVEFALITVYRSWRGRHRRVAADWHPDGDLRAATRRRINKACALMEQG